MKVVQRFVVIGLWLIFALVTTLKAEQSTDTTVQRALLDTYCIGCHNESIQSGKLRLDNTDLATVDEHGELWERVIAKLRGGLMPPQGMPRPEKTTYNEFASWLENELDQTAITSPNPGRTEIFHRLNRTEYKNIVRDLLAVDMDFSDLLPTDDSGGGDAPFDNIASSLRLTQSLMETYLSVANKVSRLAIGGTPPSAELTFQMHEDIPQNVHIDGMPFGTRGGLLIDHIFPVDGEYELEINVLGRGTGKIDLALEGEQIQLFHVRPPEARSSEYGGPASKGHTLRLSIEAGPKQITAAFVKETPATLFESDRKQFFGRSQGGAGTPTTIQVLPGISNIIIKGPLTVTGKGDSPSRKKIFVCHPVNGTSEEKCAQTILETLARRAYRRAPTNRDIDLLMTLYGEGRAEADFEEGIQRGIRGILANPNFLFRVEKAPENITANTVYSISNLELASRLSFFLWSSIPDDQLLDLAIEGRLQEPSVLESQVHRMLADDRAKSLTTSFAAQWLWVRNLETSTTSDPIFPNFDEALRQAFKKEIELFFDTIVKEDRSILDLLDSDFTFVNERLAKHYGIPYIIGTDFRRIQLDKTSPRRGLLGKGQVLMVTSRSTRTSPVVRGKWILENLLGTPPPAPPANVPALPEQKQNDGRVLTVRELMAKHRANPVCASCHATIDPAGFALEQFDAIGKWREVDAGFQPIDASGTMPDGTPFSGINDFRTILMSSPDQFVHTLTDKLLMYALGRGTEYYDSPAIRQIMREVESNNYKFSSLIMSIVKSVPFRMKLSGTETTQIASK